MNNSLHFKNYQAYRRYLSFGHIHHVFHGTKKVYIAGKLHAVVHKTHHSPAVIHEELVNGTEHEIPLETREQHMRHERREGPRHERTDYGLPNISMDPDKFLSLSKSKVRFHNHFDLNVKL